jgi:hypothetical protein
MKSWFTQVSKPHDQPEIAAIPVPTPAITPQVQIECAEKHRHDRQQHLLQM